MSESDQELKKICDDAEIYFVTVFNKIGAILIDESESPEKRNWAKHALLNLLNMIKFHSDVISSKLLKFVNGQYAGVKIK